MLFTEFRFLVFFVAIFSVYWTLKRDRLRKLLLLGASYAFYAAWDWRFLSLILISTLLDYTLGRLMEGRPDRRQRLPLLVLSLIGNLGLLGFFKYYDFFVESAGAFAAWLGLPMPLETLGIIVPVGISFYTFQTLSYTIDLYRGRIRAIHDLPDFALFVAFFPQLVAGPIVRASEFLPQLTGIRRFGRDVAVRSALSQFLFGYIKKAVVADNIGQPVDAVFADPAAFATGSLWLAVSLYAIQIYCDFSGYTDMAIASARLLGYRLPVNFNFPYLGRNITDFWRRWHISLSSWLRDYLYIPLGGGRVAPWKVYRNLIVVFFLCGLWHGASWHFVVWGLFHGVFLMVERLGLRVRLERSGAWIQHAYTVLVVLVGWVFFRTTDLSAAGVYLGGMFGAGGGVDIIAPTWWWAVLAFTVVHVAMDRQLLSRTLRGAPDWAFALLLGGGVALVLPWAASGYQPFIYFQF